MRVCQLEFFGREGAHVLHVFLGIRTGLHGQIAQKRDDLFGRLRHLRHHRHLAEITVSQQLRLLLAQGEDFVDQGRVVEPCGRALALVTGAGDVGPVQAFAQGAAEGVLHHRQIAWHLQREFVTLLALSGGGVARRLNDVFRHAVQFVSSRMVGVGIGGIQCVLTELLAQFGLPLLNSRKPLFGRAAQVGPT